VTTAAAAAGERDLDDSPATQGISWASRPLNEHLRAFEVKRHVVNVCARMALYPASEPIAHVVTRIWLVSILRRHRGSHFAIHPEGDAESLSHPSVYRHVQAKPFVVTVLACMKQENRRYHLMPSSVVFAEV
jgi:hypothetical protein